MKDIIAKLQMDANVALGGIWMHIDAQAARIAELEAQIAAKADTDKQAWSHITPRDFVEVATAIMYQHGLMDDLSYAKTKKLCEDMEASFKKLPHPLQAPVREVPEDTTLNAITLPDSWLKVSEHGNPPDGLYMAIYKGDGKSMPVTLAGYGEYEFYSEDDDRETTGIGWVEYIEDPNGDCFTIVRDVIAYLPVNVDMASLKAVRASLPAAPVQQEGDHGR